ncbi:hypothetical protein C8Q73DRAFT_166365 [Cubamyces lactineus]|nr:hypothetical protein C8Q73DRAFT_166365 [Cubamyces lactineus]
MSAVSSTFSPPRAYHLPSRLPARYAPPPLTELIQTTRDTETPRRTSYASPIPITLIHPSRVTTSSASRSSHVPPHHPSILYIRAAAPLASCPAPPGLPGALLLYPTPYYPSRPIGRPRTSPALSFSCRPLGFPSGALCVSCRQRPCLYHFTYRALLLPRYLLTSPRSSFRTSPLPRAGSHCYASSVQCLSHLVHRTYKEEGDGSSSRRRMYI